MAIERVIREKRKELGFTQEQVADYLGISAPAVNKWEKGVTYPDISLLAPLARLLQTDVNTLLGYKEELTDQEIGQFGNEIMQTIMQSGFATGVELAQKKLEEYPNHMKLLHTVALLLEGAMILSGLSEQEKQQFETLLLSLYERMLLGNDMELRNSAAFMLASKYIAGDSFEKAQEMIDFLPLHNEMDKRLLQANLYKAQDKIVEAEVIHEQMMVKEVTQVWNHQLSLIEMELQLGHIAEARELTDICCESAKALQMPEYYQAVPDLMLAIGEKNCEESIRQLERMLQASEKGIGIWNFSDTTLYQHIEQKQPEEGQKISMILALFQEIEKENKYEFLRSSKEYEILQEKYQLKN